MALLTSVAVTGHEAVGSGVALALPAAVLHLAAMAVWLGGLVLLGLVVLPGAEGRPAHAGRGPAAALVGDGLLLRGGAGHHR